MPRSALPRIKLPSFSGDYQAWRPFHDLFTSLIKDNADLTTVEKMHYLSGSQSVGRDPLRGRVKELGGLREKFSK